MGLLRTAARTAVVAGTATRVHGAVAARQRHRWAQQAAGSPPEPPPGPPPQSPSQDTATVIAHLKQLGELRDAGVLTTAEFQAEKDRILYG
ncbi:SHOCT domain-containing protein [Actinoplanes sp. NPDC051633]|uniref:SHOCT domain-containing protein n=1 Tax=Actinoplanes sp. NPDC051633 TaxID=3155670 RepID=UPI00343CB52A